MKWGVFIGIAMNWKQLFVKVIFTTLILLTHEHGLFFFQCSSLSLQSFISSFHCYRSFTFLVRFIPRCLIFSQTICKWKCVVISLCLLLVYGKAINLCNLILCPVALMNLFIIFKNFLVGFLGYLIYIKYHVIYK